jgi:hypothetical protein
MLTRERVIFAVLVIAGLTPTSVRPRSSHLRRTQTGSRIGTGKGFSTA